MVINLDSSQHQHTQQSIKLRRQFMKLERVLFIDIALVHLSFQSIKDKILTLKCQHPSRH